jgi:hypothetical protein
MGRRMHHPLFSVPHPSYVLTSSDVKDEGKADGLAFAACEHLGGFEVHASA